MTQKHLSINPSAVAGNGFSTFILSVADCSAANSLFPGALPTVVSGGQAYFWTHKWQALENESAAALQAGDYAEFHDPGDAIRWLLSDDEG